ncbi:MAG: hypothetical protein ACRCYO_02320 [Bacteroidia bacterium]
MTNTEYLPYDFTMPTTQRTAQQVFIQRIKDIIPTNHSLVDELADILAVSTDSAYRRIRGETALSIDEVSILCSHYRISFDTESSKNGNGVTFSYHPLSSDEKNFAVYLNNIARDMQRIRSAGQREIIFAAEDIPIFHHFKYPLLSGFKLFYWSRSILNAPGLEGKKFDPKMVDPELCALVESVYDLYLEIPSIEIWSEDTLNSTLKQIEYYWESGFFNNQEEALAVLADVESMVNDISRQAEHGCKFRGEVPTSKTDNNYTLYNSELMIGNNCILVTIGGSKVTYLSHNTFNSMATTSPGFCDETERWLRNLIRKSIPISGVSEKQRFRFFRNKLDKITKLRELISSAH